jgi:integrase
VSGHLEQGSAKNCHAKATTILLAASDAYREWTKKAVGNDWQDWVSEAVGLEKGFIARHATTIIEGFSSFQPYCLRHTALTRLAEAGCDAFTLARIAGHSSITITQRYCHPQAEAVERAFKRLGGHKSGHRARFLPEVQGATMAVSKTA